MNTVIPRKTAQKMTIDPDVLGYLIELSTGKRFLRELCEPPPAPGRSNAGQVGEIPTENVMSPLEKLLNALHSVQIHLAAGGSLDDPSISSAKEEISPYCDRSLVLRDLLDPHYAR